MAGARRTRQGQFPPRDEPGRAFLGGLGQLGNTFGVTA